MTSYQCLVATYQPYQKKAQIGAFCSSWLHKNTGQNKLKESKYPFNFHLKLLNYLAKIRKTSTIPTATHQSLSQLAVKKQSRETKPLFT